MIQSDFQAEQAIIGDIILAPEKTLSQALHELSGEEFQATQFRTLFGIFRELFREKKPIDAVTVLAKAGEEYQNTVLDACLLYTSSRGESSKGRASRGESPRGESSKGGSSRGESPRGESPRGGSSRGES